MNMILLNHGSELKDRFYEDMKNKVSKQDSSVAKARPIAKSRESLQSGESSIMMTDDKFMISSRMTCEKSLLMPKCKEYQRVTPFSSFVLSRV